MNKRVFIILLLLLVGFLTASCDTGGGKYKLQILRSGNEIIIECIFSGEDTNRDGIIDASELTAFEETENYEYVHTSSSFGWGAFVDVEKMPMLSHGIDDIMEFRFYVDEFEKGNTLIDYSTNSSADLVFESYHFWRTVRIENNGSEITVADGIGDGTQGLALTMLDTNSLTYRIEKQ
jgi:hypothetical protein